MKVYVVLKETSFYYGKEDIYSLCRTAKKANKDILYIEKVLKMRARFQIMSITD